MDLDIEMVTIPRDEYNTLLSESAFLNCLYNAGVDNWDGYEYAQEEYAEGGADDCH